MPRARAASTREEWGGMRPGPRVGSHPLVRQALARNSSLTELDLRNNGISSTGAGALGEMLAKNTSLKRIDLRWNNLGASGGRALLDGLQRNSSVIELTLAGNKVADETLRSIEHLLHKVRAAAFSSYAWHWPGNLPKLCRPCAESRTCG